MSKKSQKSKLLDAKEGYDIYASTYENDHAFLNTFEKAYLFNMLGDIKGKKALDAGCGDGRLSEQLMKFGADVSGCDVSEEMIKICNKKFIGKDFIVADVENMPYPDESFDLIVSTFVIVHLDFLEDFFDECFRILKPEGTLIVSNINQRKPPKLKTKNNEHIVIRSKYHRPDAVIKALEHSLFTIEEEEFVHEGKVWINQIIKAKK